MRYPYTTNLLVEENSLLFYVANPVNVQLEWSQLFIDWLVHDDQSEDPKGPDGYSWNTVESAYHVCQGAWVFSNILNYPSEPSWDENNCMSIVLKQSFVDSVLANFAGRSFIGFELNVDIHNYGYNPNLDLVRVIVSELGTYNNDYIGYNGAPYFITQFFNEEDTNANFNGTKMFIVPPDNELFIVDNWANIEPPVFSLQQQEGMIRSLKLYFGDLGPNNFWTSTKNCIEILKD